MKRETEIKRTFVFTQKELKEKLGIIGKIQRVGLWSSLSPKEEEEKCSTDKNEFYFETIEHSA